MCCVTPLHVQPMGRVRVQEPTLPVVHLPHAALLELVVMALATEGTGVTRVHKQG